MTSTEIAIGIAKEDMELFKSKSEHCMAHGLQLKAQVYADRWTMAWLDLIYLEHLDVITEPISKAVCA